QVRLSMTTLKEHEETETNFRPPQNRRQSIASSKLSDPGPGQGQGQGLNPILVNRRLSRRGSMMGSQIMSLLAHRRMSRMWTQQSDDGPSKLPKHVEPTYKLEPDDQKRFAVAKVEAAIESIFNVYLDDKEYDPTTCKDLAVDLANMIKNRIKDFDFKRFRLVSHVIIGQCQDQGIEATSRCVWNTNTDRFASVKYKNATLFAVATVFGVYLD
ncbi:unnamed protein product, partial [Owenia fusiformis]